MVAIQDFEQLMIYFNDLFSSYNIKTIKMMADDATCMYFNLSTPQSELEGEDYTRICT